MVSGAPRGQERPRGRRVRAGRRLRRKARPPASCLGGPRASAHGHPALRPYGNGVLLWFQMDDFEAVVERAREMRVEILEGPRVNPNANHREIWLRDPDGYVVVLASAYGDL